MHPSRAPRHTSINVLQHLLGNIQLFKFIGLNVVRITFHDPLTSARPFMMFEFKLQRLIEIKRITKVSNEFY